MTHVLRMTKAICITMALALTMVVSSILIINYCKNFNKFNFDSLYRVNEFKSIIKLSSLIKDLELTVDQRNKAMHLIDENRFFKLNQLELSDKQIEIVKNTSENSRNFYKIASLVCLAIFALALFYAVYFFRSVIFSDCRKKDNSANSLCDQKEEIKQYDSLNSLFNLNFITDHDKQLKKQGKEENSYRIG